MSNLDKLVNELSSLTIIEASELTKKLEQKWQVKHSVEKEDKKQETEKINKEKSHYDIVIESVGDKKLQVIKEVRNIIGGGLIEAKKLIESEKKVIKTSIIKEKAIIIKNKLELIGAKVKLK